MIYRKLGCLLLGVVFASGQSLNIKPVSGAPGENITIEISLEVPPDRKPSALQWELVFPAQLLEPEQPPAELGVAVKDSGKNLTCAGRNAYTQVCILAGGQKNIPNGIITTFQLKIRSEAKAGATTVKVSKAQGVTSELKPLAFKDVDAPITIR